MSHVSKTTFQSPAGGQRTKGTQETPCPTHLKLWVEGEQEGLPGAVEAVADLERLGGQRSEHLARETTEGRHAQHGHQLQQQVSFSPAAPRALWPALGLAAASPVHRCP